MGWSEELVLEFLDHYEGEEILWNGHRVSCTKSDIEKAWKRIQKSLSANLTVTELKTMKRSTMNRYRKLKKKGRSTDGELVCQPGWFAFQKMDSFLKDVYNCESSSENTSSGEDAPSNLMVPTVIKDSNVRPSKRRKLTEKTENGTLEDCKELKDYSTALFCKLLEAKLVSITNTNRLIVMHEIDGLLFHARLMDLGSRLIGTPDSTAEQSDS